jgi:hypothetical protein
MAFVGAFVAALVGNFVGRKVGWFVGGSVGAFVAWLIRRRFRWLIRRRLFTGRQRSQNRHRGRVGDAILQLQKEKDVGFGASAVAEKRYLHVNVPVQSTIRCASDST